MTVFQKGNVSSIVEESSRRGVDVDESTESYLNHPTLGLLYSVGELGENLELFTTIYAMRLFFLVTTSATSIFFESIGRTDARSMVEKRLRHLRCIGQFQEYDKLQVMYQQTFL